MEKFIFTNKFGQSVSIGYSDSNYTLVDYEGLSTVEVIPTAYKGYMQNGNTITNISAGVRIIRIEFIDTGETISQIYQKRKILHDVFNPLYLGTLSYNNGQIIYVLENVEVSTQPTAIERYGRVQKYEVELTAHNPFFRDNVLTTKVLSSTTTSSVNYQFNYAGNVPTGFILQTKISQPISAIRVTVDNKERTGIIQTERDFEFGTYTWGYAGICTQYGQKGTTFVRGTERVYPQELSFNSTWDMYGFTSDSQFVNLQKAQVNNLVNVQIVDGSADEIKLKYYNWYSGI